MKHYFFRSDSVFRLKPLPHQTLEQQNSQTEVPMDENIFAAGNRSTVESYPVGTVFGTDTVAMVNQTYQVGKLSVLSQTPKGAKDQPSQEMTRDWTAFLAVYPDVLKEKQDEDIDKSVPLYRIAEQARNISANLEKKGFSVDERVVRTIISNIETQSHVMLVGPTGTGKSELVMKIGQEMGLPVRIFDMGSMYDPLSQLLGNKTLTVDPVTKTTVTGFETARFAEEVQKPGIILLDELSRANPMVANILLPCLDSRQMLPMEMAGCGKERVVNVDPECVFIATANIGVEYTGTKTMDSALTDRFDVVELDYLSADKEREVLENRFHIGRQNAEKIAICCERIRTICKQNDIRHTVSTRNAIAIASFVALGWSVRQAVEAKVYPLFSNEGEENSERQIIRNVVESCC